MPTTNAEPKSPVCRTGKDLHNFHFNPQPKRNDVIKNELHRLRSAHAKVAKLVMEDVVYLPIFERLEAELEAAEAKENGNPVAYARAAMAAQNAMR